MNTYQVVFALIQRVGFEWPMQTIPSGVGKMRDVAGQVWILDRDSSTIGTQTGYYGVLVCIIAPQ